MLTDPDAALRLGPGARRPGRSSTPHGKHDVIVNVQGDTPTLDPAALRAVIGPLDDPAVDIATLVTPIASEEEASTPSFVKAACVFGDGNRVGASAVLLSLPSAIRGRAALAPHRHLRLSTPGALDRFVALSRKRARAPGSDWNNFVPWRPGCALTCTSCGVMARLASTRRHDLAAGTGDPCMTVSFQGRPGAYSDLACRAALPGRPTLPCDTFVQAIDAVRSGHAELAMLPCENSLAGRVPDIHQLLPGSGLHIVGEHFQRVEHCLLGLPGAVIGDIKRVHSHAVALGQVRQIVRELDVLAVVEADTAGSAQWVAANGNKEDAAIASCPGGRDVWAAGAAVECGGFEG